MRSKHRRPLRTLLIITGTLLIACSAALLISNRIADRQAGENSARIVKELKTEIRREASTENESGSPQPSGQAESQDFEEEAMSPSGPSVQNTPEETTEETSMPSPVSAPVYEAHPEAGMPLRYIEGNAYAGRLTIPVLHLDLPVMNDWNYRNLKIAPCRYAGSVYLDNLVIAAHNYLTHFGRIHTLSSGDEVIFTDTDGNSFVYTVAAIEILSPFSVRDMKESTWDLTLFTCTYGGQFRVTVRCQQKSD